MITVYGIKNCNTIKKCFDYLNGANIAYEFVDYKKQSIDFETFFVWVAQFGLQKVINQQGTTYKKLGDNQKAVIAQAMTRQNDWDKDSLLPIYDIVAKQLSVIKRPIITGVYGDKNVALIGFDKTSYDDVFGL